MRRRQRIRRRMWRNGKGGQWDCRIVWYEQDDGTDIRLALEDAERKQNAYPKSKQEAEQIWSAFKRLAPKPGSKSSCIARVLAEGADTSVVSDEKPKPVVEASSKRQELVARLAAAADAWGLRACDVVHEPGCCEQYNIDPNTITPAIAHDADDLNRREFEALLKRYNIGPYKRERHGDDEPEEPEENVERDEFGFDIKSRGAAVNTVILEDGAESLDEVVESTGFRRARCERHLKRLLADGHISGDLDHFEVV